MTDAQQIEQYLRTLHSHLQGRAAAEHEEIVREVAAYLQNVAWQDGTALATPVQRLGPPEELAHRYNNLALAFPSGSPKVTGWLTEALRVFTRAVTGLLVLCAAILGYTTCVGLVLTALLKLLFPAFVGVWMSHGHFLGAGALVAHPPDAQEMLKGNYIPVALITSGILLAATQIGIRSALGASRRLQGRLDVGLAPLPR